MPSPAHAADLERVLSRAAQECESKRSVWFGEGLPQDVRSALEALGQGATKSPAELALVEVTAVSRAGRATTDEDPSMLGCPVIGLSTATLDELGSLVGAASEAGTQLTRLICPVGVFDFTQDGIRVREVRHGLTAADLQRELTTPLLAGPDLKELGTH
jgi:hypothetical protein